MTNSVSEATGEKAKIWSEFWKLGKARANVPSIRARVTLAQHGLPDRRQFVVETGSGHHFLVDDASGGTGPKPIELVALLGIVCLGTARTATTMSILVFGWILVFSGVAWFIGAFQARSRGGVFLYLLNAIIRGTTGYCPCPARELNKARGNNAKYPTDDKQRSQ